MILDGAVHGWSQPDDLTAFGRSLFVAFQNGVPSTGGSTGTATQSTIVKFDRHGQIERSWQIVGKCDGLGVDPHTRSVIATVNEDGNSSLYTMPADGPGAPTHYIYDANPLPHGGGTDAVTVYHDRIFLTASAPTSNGPALYQIALRAGGIAHLSAAPFYDTSTAEVANPRGGQVNLALTDPDSATVVPRQAPRFRGEFLLDSQGDQQLIFADHLGADNQQLQLLNLSQAVDDIAVATGHHGILVATDSATDTVDIVTGRFNPGTAYTAVTPGNANTPPLPTPANYLGTINLYTGAVTATPTNGSQLTPHGLIYLPDNPSD